MKKFYLTFSVILLFFCPLTIGQLYAQGWNVDLVGSYYNETDGAWKVVTDGNYAYVATGGGGLRVVALDDSLSPVVRGTCKTVDFALSVVLYGQYALVADYSAGLQIIDISNPEAPFIAGNYKTRGVCHAVAVEGHYAYIADGSGCMPVVDLSDPTEPVEVASLPLPGVCLKIYSHGNVVYLIDTNKEVNVIDATNPHFPFLTTSINSVLLAGIDRAKKVNIATVVTTGKYALFGDLAFGALVYDMEDPANPSYITRYLNPVYTHTFMLSLALVINEHYLYVCSGKLGVEIVDISNVTNPKLLRAPYYYPPSPMMDAVSMHNRLLIASEGDGLTALELYPDSWNTRETGRIFTPRVSDVKVKGNYAFLTGGWTRLKVLDVSNPAEAFELDQQLMTDSSAGNINLLGAYAYICETEGRFSIAKIRDPGSPQMNSSLPVNARIESMTMYGNHAYLSCTGQGLYIVNITNADIPFIESHIPAKECTYSSIVRENVAYVAEGSAGLRILDVTDPARPVERGMLKIASEVNKVVVRDFYAFVSIIGGSLAVVDVANPTEPVLLKIIENTGTCNDMVLVDDYLYLAMGEQGLRIYNIADPVNPLQVGFYDTPGFANRLAVVDNLVYVADNYHLHIFDCTPALSINGTEIVTPTTWSITDPYPNPFNARTSISFNLPATAEVKLAVFDLTGRRVAELFSGQAPAGSHTVNWNAQGFESGVYFVRFEAPGLSQTKRVVLLK